VRKRIRDVVGRYQRHTPHLALTFVDPDQAPQQVREAGVTVDGELVLEYRGRRENLHNLTEENLTNAIQRLARSGERQVLFLAGHGERDPDGAANFGYGEWTAQLKQKGFRLDSVNLSATPEIPARAAALVIADPRTPLLPGEVDIINRYVEQGGNLLWLTEPDGPADLAALARQLGIEPAAGVVVDPTGRMLGIDNAAFVLVAEYPAHPVTAELMSMTLLPVARPLLLEKAPGWEYTPILRSLPRSWAERAVESGEVQFDEGTDLAGPVNLGITASRMRPVTAGDGDGDAEQAAPPSQRVAVIGDADFLSNAYLGNGANLDLGNRLVNWLSHDDAFISIPPRTAPDTELTLTPTLSIVIGLGFLAVIPLGLLAAGGAIWWRRRRR
jgi:ABC-type uncharacterized transport system involved in gliding motility auxiliary subunit